MVFPLYKVKEKAHIGIPISLYPSQRWKQFQNPTYIDTDYMKYDNMAVSGGGHFEACDIIYSLLNY